MATATVRVIARGEREAKLRNDFHSSGIHLLPPNCLQGSSDFVFRYFLNRELFFSLPTSLNLVRFGGRAVTVFFVVVLFVRHRL